MADLACDGVPHARRVVLHGHPVFVAGLDWLLRHDDAVSVTATSTTTAELAALLATHRPDAVVADYDRPGGPALDMLRTCRNRPAGVRILLMSAHADPGVLMTAIRHGADGYLLKNAEPAEILSAVRSTACGSTVFCSGAMAVISAGLLAAARPVVFPLLTEREHEVLELLAVGLDNRDIARRLRVAAKTVRNHVSNILGKLQVADRAQAIVRAHQQGIGVPARDELSPPRMWPVAHPNRAA
ncbi:LuxR family two component transcriptional regulator [Stackebrandtia albiflava]|uniref:LuxR family two component transcriptional regulator n=1 Tax=Stackebrandtia albiflava TaxID=406432 RepID=A0A562V407_9ACTN|nr:response regulator transcription factor [Stackebrandtia albiflava]TWJ12603.1 LuxR family two component transcriptional regulator [Stackebrandtia albiflava]